MSLSGGQRKLWVVLHILSSSGWAGAVVVFLVLAIWALVSREPETMRAAALAMDASVSWVIVPLSIASPLTGVVLSLGTPWGLLRYYWVVVKLLLTLPSIALLFLHMGPIKQLAYAAMADRPMAEIESILRQLTIEAGVALVVLLLASVLATYKPEGRTPFAYRGA